MASPRNTLRWSKPILDRKCQHQCRPSRQRSLLTKYRTCRSRLASRPSKQVHLCLQQCLRSIRYRTLSPLRTPKYLFTAMCRDYTPSAQQYHPIQLSRLTRHRRVRHRVSAPASTNGRLQQNGKKDRLFFKPLHLRTPTTIPRITTTRISSLKNGAQNPTNRKVVRAERKVPE